MSFLANIHLYYQKITEVFPKMIDAYPNNTEHIIFLGDLFYAYVIQNNIDLFTVDITPLLLQEYIAFYYKIKNMNMDTSDNISPDDTYYKSKINNIMNTYNEYFVNNHFNRDSQPSSDNNGGIVLDFSRFGVIKEILLSDISIHSVVGMPNTVKIIHITHCMLKSIGRIPLFAEYVSCAHNCLTRLPDMHHNMVLNILICSNNRLSKLPKLPGFMYRLFCNNNLLTALPVHLPNHLKILYCNYNQITKIEALPSRLSLLSCSYNRLKDMDAVMHLHHLKILYCNNNYIEEIPVLPISIQEVNHTHNPIQNYFPYPTGVRVH